MTPHTATAGDTPALNANEHDRTLAAAFTAAALATACGGGADDMPPALLDASAAPRQPALLPRVGAAPASGGAPQARAAARTPTPTELFEWAQRQFPALFSGTPTNGSAQVLVYRFYPATGHYLAVSGDSVLVLGPLTQGGVVNVGTLQSFAEAVAAGGGAAPANAAEAARFLLHTQFSASETEMAAVQQKGYAQWLDEQLALPNSGSGWDWLVSKGYSVIDTNEYFFASGIYHFMVWHQLLQSPDAVRRRWAWALSEVFVVSWRGIKDVMNWDSFGMAEYWDLLCRHAFGNYRDLLEALTLNPAMGAFLSTRGNAKEDAATGRQPDENYAREVMQLFSIGLHMLNLDGTVQRGANGQPLETYGPDDVSQLARVFTGYNQHYALGSFNSPKPPHLRVANLETARGRMVFDANQHSTLEKRFLGVTIAANTPGPEALRLALDALANHPNTAPFLARQFIQRMVTSNPSPAYVQRVAQVFNNNGTGVRGDLKAVLKAIVLDDEALNATNLVSTTFGKLREPVLRVAQWGRTFRARSLRNTWKMRLSDYNPTQDMAQYPLDPPSVFGYFRPGYVPPGTAMAAAGATAPEFQIVNESTVAGWANALITFIPEGFYVSSPERPEPHLSTATDGRDIVPDYTAEKALVHDLPALVARLNLLLCANQLSANTVQQIVAALQLERLPPNASDISKQWLVARALLFVMCAPEYLAQR